MKTRIILLCVFVMMSMTQSFGGVTLTVPEVNIAPGTTSYVVINFDLGSQAYTAYQFDIAYPEGISSVDDSDSNPTFIKGDVYNNAHSVSSGYAPDGKARFQCFSTNSVAFTAQSGTLLILSVKAAKSLAEGIYQATISPIEFSQTNATPDRPDAVTFNIKVSNFVVLDENSIAPPVSATGVNVNVKRTIAADTWSTICLPFAMTEEQVKNVFGSDVKLGDFKGYVVTEVADEIVGITVNFDAVTAIEGNHPYIIKVSKAVTEFTIYGVDIAPQDVPYVSFGWSTGRYSEIYHPKDFVGTYVANFDFYHDAQKKALFINGNKFYYATENTKHMKAFRAYFDFDDYLPEAGGGATARAIMSFDGNGTTGIETIKFSPTRSSIYSLNGQYLGESSGFTKLPKGIYVVNGKKVIK